MDKHQRKQTAQWEVKKAKAQHKSEEERKRDSYTRAIQHIAQTVREWEPEPNETFARARKVLAGPWSYYALHYMSVDEDVEHYIFMNRYRLVSSSRIHRISMNKLEVAAEIAEQTSTKREARAIKLARVLYACRGLVDTIRDELLEKTERLRAIQNCLLIKEELMQAVWHPRRVERIIEVGGWDLLDNLLGC